MAPTKPYKKANAPLADFIIDAMRPAARRRGFAAADLVAVWPDLVGERYAGATLPESLKFPRRSEADPDSFEPGTLTIRCEGSLAIFLQHETPQLVERINGFFGYQAVGAIRILQRPVAVLQSAEKKPKKPLSPDDSARIDTAVDGIAEDGLREALRKLGTGVVSRRT